jgi:hypothetical protein
MVSKSQRVAVIGGGITGVAFCAHAVRLRLGEVTLFERADALGGLHKSPEIDGYHYDIGAFLFGSDHPIFSAFPNLIDDFVPFKVNVRTVMDEGKQDIYPISMRGYLANHGKLGMLRAFVSIIRNKWISRRRDTLAAFCRYYVGDDIYEGNGLRNYIERLYSLPHNEIALLFATKRMSVLADAASLRRLLARKVSAMLKPPDRGNNVAFARPRRGFEHMYTHIEGVLSASGVDVQTGANIRSIEKLGSTFVVSTDNESKEYDIIVSTAPIPVTARLINVPVHQNFETVNLLTLFYEVDGDLGFDAAFMSNFSNSGRWKRIIDLTYIYGNLGSQHRISVEIPIAGDPELVDVQIESTDFIANAQSLCLLVRAQTQLLGHHLTRNSYPIYRPDSVTAIERDKRTVTEWGIHLCGRQGDFDYVSSAQAAASGIALAQRLSIQNVTAGG